jgi:hypothetical protein
MEKDKVEEFIYILENELKQIKEDRKIEAIRNAEAKIQCGY